MCVCLSVVYIVVLCQQLGGTVGDIESMPFIEAFRQFQFKVKKENFCNIHVSLIPQVWHTGEHMSHILNQLSEIVDKCIFSRRICAEFACVSSAQYDRRAENQTNPEQCPGAQRARLVSRFGE